MFECVECTSIVAGPTNFPVCQGTAATLTNGVSASISECYFYFTQNMSTRQNRSESV